MALKDILKKDVSKPKKEVKAQIKKHFVAKRNVEKMKKEGWKIAVSDLKELGMSNAARKQAIADQDIVLMIKDA